MSSDQQNINQVQYSDDSDYEHRDSVLSTGHRNSLAHRQSVSNRRSIADRQSKRLSYGRKHNESKIEEILNKVVEEENRVEIHQTESHIVGEGVGDSQSGEKTQTKEQETVVSSQTGNNNNQTTTQNDSNMNYSQMLVSINDSQNQSGVFEVMEMSQGGQQQPQSRIQPQEEKVKNEQVKNEDLDYLPDEPYVEVNRQEPKGDTNQQVVENEVKEQNEATQQVEQPNTQNQQQKAQQQQQQKQAPQQQQQPQPQSHQTSESNPSQQPQTLAQQQQIDFLPQTNYQPQSHTLGDEFNRNQQQAQEEILNSFRDSTEEKRRNRVPGNSQIEYGDQNDYYVSEDGVNVRGYGRMPLGVGDEKREQQQKQQEVVEVVKQQNQQKPQETKKQPSQQPIQQTQSQPHTTQQTQPNQTQQQPSQTQPIAQQEPNQQPEQQTQQQRQANEQNEHIITSQDVDLRQEPQESNQPQREQVVEQGQTVLQKVAQQRKEIKVQEEQVQQPIVESTIAQQQAQPQSQVQQHHQQAHQHQQVPEVTQVEPQTQQIQETQQQPQQQQQQQWPSSYGQPQQPQHSQQQPVAQPYQQKRHQQVQSVISQPNLNNDQSSDQQQQQPNQQQQQQTSNSALDQRIPIPDSDQQLNNTTSNILPPSQISTHSQPNQGMISVISFTTQRQSQQLQQVLQIQQQQRPENTEQQRFLGIQVDVNKAGPSHVVASKIRESNRSIGEVGELQSQKDPSQIILEQSLQESRQGIETVPQQQQQVDSSQPANDHHIHPQQQQQQQLAQPPQSISQSQFIKIQQDNSSFAHSQSNMRYLQSDIPMGNNHQQQQLASYNKPSQPQLLAQVPPAVMTRVESSEELPETPVKLLDESKKNKEIEASEYFVVDKNLSSLDIYRKSEYNKEFVNPPQLGSNQSMSERESVLPHPLKSQLLKQAEKRNQLSRMEQNQQQQHQPLPKASEQVSARVSVPKVAQPQKQAPKFQQSQEPLRNSVSNADLVISTSELKSTNKPKKEKAGSNHKPPLENAESCKCVIF